LERQEEKISGNERKESSCKKKRENDSEASVSGSFLMFFNGREKKVCQNDEAYSSWNLYVYSRKLDFQNPVQHL